MKLYLNFTSVFCMSYVDFVTHLPLYIDMYGYNFFF